MAKVDAEKIKQTIERRKTLLALLEEDCYEDKDLDKLMKWENAREKAILFGQLRDMELIPVKHSKTIEHPELGEVEAVVNWVVPLDEHAEFMEKEKNELAAEKAKAKKPKNPQAMRAKAELALTTKMRAYTAALLKLEGEMDSEIHQLKVVIAQAQVRLSEIRRDEVAEKLIIALELKDRAEYNGITDLDALV